LLLHRQVAEEGIHLGAAHLGRIGLHDAAHLLTCLQVLPVPLDQAWLLGVALHGSAGGLQDPCLRATKGRAVARCSIRSHASIQTAPNPGGGMP